MTTKEKQRGSDERLGGKDNGRRSNVQNEIGEGTKEQEIERGHRADHTYSMLSMPLRQGRSGTRSSVCSQASEHLSAAIPGR
jgi:hypothetical protein